MYNGAINVAGQVIDSAFEFIENMEELADTTLGKPDLYVSVGKIPQIVKALTSTGNNSALAMMLGTETIEIMPGVKIKIRTWDETPWIDIEDDEAGLQILNFDELNPDGVALDTASIYAMKLGVKFFKMLQDRPPEVVSDQGTTSQDVAIDWAIQTVAEHPRSIARKRGIILA